MTKSGDRLAKELSERFGVDAAPIVAFLYKARLTDDVLVRNHFVRMEWIHRYTTTDKSERQVESDISEDFGTSRTAIQRATADLVGLVELARTSGQ